MDLLRSMRVFARVVDEGSFAAAARTLELGPAIVTRAVAELEEELGARLLHRTTRRLALTEIGTAYLDRVRQILADIDDAAAMASARTHELRGTVRLLVPPAVAVHQIAKHLPRLQERHPELSLEVDALAPVEAAGEAFDLSIVWAIEPLRGEYIARRLARTETVLCATPDYLDRRGRPSHPVELERHETLTPPIGELQRGLEFVHRGHAAGALRLPASANPAGDGARRHQLCRRTRRAGRRGPALLRRRGRAGGARARVGAAEVAALRHHPVGDDADAQACAGTDARGAGLPAGGLRRPGRGPLAGGRRLRDGAAGLIARQASSRRKPTPAGWMHAPRKRPCHPPPDPARARPTRQPPRIERTRPCGHPPADGRCPDAASTLPAPCGLGIRR